MDAGVGIRRLGVFNDLPDYAGTDDFDITGAVETSKSYPTTVTDGNIFQDSAYDPNSGVLQRQQDEIKKKTNEQPKNGNDKVNGANETPEIPYLLIAFFLAVAYVTWRG